MSTDQIPRLVAAYLSLRETIREADATHEAKQQPRKDALARAEQHLLSLMPEGASSLRTDHGTVIVSVKAQPQVLDWSTFHQFIIENNRPDMLQRRPSSEAVTTYMENNPEALPPPGVTVVRTRTVSVRVPTKKG